MGDQNRAASTTVPQSAQVTKRAYGNQHRTGKRVLVDGDQWPEPLPAPLPAALPDPAPEPLPEPAPFAGTRVAALTVTSSCCAPEGPPSLEKPATVTALGNFCVRKTMLFPAPVVMVLRMV